MSKLHAVTNEKAADMGIKILDTVTRATAGENKFEVFAGLVMAVAAQATELGISHQSVVDSLTRVRSTLEKIAEGGTTYEVMPNNRNREAN